MNRTKLFACLALFVVGGFAVYGKCLTYGFVNLDDPMYLLLNPAVLHFDGIYQIWSRLELPDDTTNWPLTYTMFWIEHRLWNLDPMGYHAVNVVLHGTAAFWIGLSLTKLRIRPMVAWSAAFLFVMHPMHADVASWVSQRKSVLSTNFFFLALWAYAYFVTASVSRWRWYSLYIGSFALALLSKSTTVVLPVVAMLADYCFVADAKVRSSTAQQVPPLLLACLAAMQTLWAERTAVAHTSLLDRLGDVLRSQGFYAIKLVWPADLTLFYSETQLSLVALSVAVALYLALWAARTAKNRGSAAWSREAMFGLGFFIVCEFPVSGFIPFGWMKFAPVANHLCYLPSVGFLTVLSVCYWEAARRTRLPDVATLVSLALIGACLGIVAAKNSERWRSSETLMATVDGQSSNRSVCLLLARWFSTQPSRADEALQYFEALRSRFPGWPRPLILSADVHERRGDDSTAIQLLKKAIAIEPDGVDQQILLGHVYAKSNRTEEAVECYKKALAHNRQPSVLAKLGATLLTLEQPSKTLEAREYLAEAVRLAPLDAENHFLYAFALARLNDWPAAERQFQRSIELDDSYRPAYLRFMRTQE